MSTPKERRSPRTQQKSFTLLVGMAGMGDVYSGGQSVDKGDEGSVVKAQN